MFYQNLKHHIKCGAASFLGNSATIIYLRSSLTSHYISPCVLHIPLGSIRAKASSTKVGKSKSKLTRTKKVTKDKAQQPTSGFIGKTRFDLIPRIFERSLPTIVGQGINLQNLLDKTVHAHDKIINNHGVIEGTKKWKVITNYCNELLEGRNPDNPGWVATGKTNKWPRVLGHLLPVFIFIKDNILNEDLSKELAEARRLMLTLFKLNRVCAANTEIESHLVAIKSKHRIEPEYIAEFEKFVQTKLASVRESITLTDISFDLFLGPSNGPNSVPKLKSALEEAAVLRKNDKLYSAFKGLCIATGNNHFLEFFEKSSKNYQVFENKHIKLRKLTTIPDKGNKSRAVAICDFWTQSIMASIEEIVIGVTRDLYSGHCCYWSHSEGWRHICSWPKEVSPEIVSLDASSWTDNFPASLQLIVVKALFGQKFANYWNELVVSCPWHIPHMPRPVFYGKGQGMGTKGSFAIAQLTDLIFVEFIYSYKYPNMKAPYFMKVGDDLVLQDPDMKFASEYERIGVPINLQKSKFYTTYGSFMEFVSRNSWNGIDYSVISASLVSKFLRNDYYASTLFDHMKERLNDPVTLSELLAMKTDVKQTETNFDSVRHAARQRTLMKIIRVLDIIRPESPVLTADEFDWNPSKNEILLLLENLILVTLAELCLQHVNIDAELDEKSRTTNSLNWELLHEFLATSKSISVGSSTKQFYKRTLDAGHTFRETVTLRKAMPILRSLDQKHKAGLIKYMTGTQTVLPPLARVDDGTFVANPEFIDFLLRTQDLLQDNSQGYKTLRTGPLFDKNRTAAVLNLYRLLNNIINLESQILDIDNGRYSLPKNVKGPEELMIPMDLIQGHIKLFKFDVMLADIASARLDESVNVSLFPVTTTGVSG